MHTQGDSSVYEFKPGSRWAFGALGIGLVQEVTGHDVVLRLPFSRATVRLRMERARQQLRKPIEASAVGPLLEILRAPSEPGPREHPTRRFKFLREKLSLGLPEEVAAIYRDLGRRAILSFTERRFCEHAKKLLVGELSLVMPDAERKIKEAAGCLR